MDFLDHDFGQVGEHVGEVFGAPSVASGVMWLATYGLRQFEWTSQPALLLAAHVLAGAVCYLLTLHLLSRSHLRDLRRALSTLARRT